MTVYWLEQSEPDIPRDSSWMSAAERARLDALRFPKRRADWRLGRWTAKRAVAAYLARSGPAPHLASIEVRPAASGAPEVFTGDRPAPVTISLSHRDGSAACAIAAAGVDLGCDLEAIEPRSEGFVVDYFTAEERALIASARERWLVVALLWSAKESALKALRTGLRADTRSVIVRPAGGVADPVVPASWCALRVRHAGGQEFEGWWQAAGKLLRTLVVAPASPPPVLF